MGLFDDFDIDMDDVKAAGGFSFADGFYEWEISEALRQQGTKNKPDTTFFIIKYNLDEDGTYWEWFTLAEDGDTTTENVKRSLGYLKERLLALGIAASELNTIDPEDLEGITGSFKLVTSKGPKGEFQNIRNLKANLDETETEEETEEAEESDSDIKKRVAAKRAARDEPAAKTATKRAPSSKGRAAADTEDNDNPFG